MTLLENMFSNDKYRTVDTLEEMGIYVELKLLGIDSYVKIYKDANIKSKSEEEMAAIKKDVVWLIDFWFAQIELGGDWITDVEI